MKVNAFGVYFSAYSKKFLALVSSALIILLVLSVDGFRKAGILLALLRKKLKDEPAYLISALIHIALLVILGIVNPNGKQPSLVLTEVTIKDFAMGGDDDTPSDKPGEGIGNPRPIRSVSPSEVNPKKQEVVDPSKVSGTGTDSVGVGGGGTGGGLVVNLPEQKPIEKPVDNVYRSAVEEMPEPYGGYASISSRVSYPETAKEGNIRGTVYVLAFIDENGFVRRALLSKGIGGGCDEVAVAAVRKTRFIAGKHKGEQVKVQMLIAVEFPPR